MRKAGIAELKAGLSEYLAAVKAGAEVVVTERGRPSAVVRARSSDREDRADPRRRRCLRSARATGPRRIHSRAGERFRPKFLAFAAPGRSRGVGPGRPALRTGRGPVRFWDSSGLVPLALGEPASPTVEQIFRQDTSLALWWGTPVECASALERAISEKTIDRTALQAARRGPRVVRRPTDGG